MIKRLETLKTGLAHNRPMTAILLGSIGCFALVDILQGDILGLLMVLVLGLVCICLHIRCALLERNGGGEK